jgi:hypothetical protein
MSWLGKAATFAKDKVLPWVIEKGLPLAINALSKLCAEVFEDECLGVIRAAMLVDATCASLVIEDNSQSSTRVFYLLMQHLFMETTDTKWDGSSFPTFLTGISRCVVVIGHNSFDPTLPTPPVDVDFHTGYSSSGTFALMTSPMSSKMFANYRPIPSALDAAAAWVQETVSQGVMSKNVDATVDGMAAGVTYKFLTARGGDATSAVPASVARTLAVAMHYLADEVCLPQHDRSHLLGLAITIDTVQPVVTFGDRWPLSPNPVPAIPVINAWVIDANMANLLLVNTFKPFGAAALDPLFPSADTWDSDTVIVPIGPGSSYRGAVGAYWALMHMEYPYQSRSFPANANNIYNYAAGATLPNDLAENLGLWRLQNRVNRSRIAGRVLAGGVVNVVFVLVDTAQKAVAGVGGGSVPIGYGANLVNLEIANGTNAPVDIGPAIDQANLDHQWCINWPVLLDNWWALGGNHQDWRTAVAVTSLHSGRELHDPTVVLQRVGGGPAIDNTPRGFTFPIVGAAGVPWSIESPRPNVPYANEDLGALPNTLACQTDWSGNLGLTRAQVRAGTFTDLIPNITSFLYIQIANKILIHDADMAVTGMRHRGGTFALASTNCANLLYHIHSHALNSFTLLSGAAHLKSLPLWVKYPFDTGSRAWHIKHMDWINHLIAVGNYAALRVVSNVQGPNLRLAATQIASWSTPGGGPSTIPATSPANWQWQTLPFSDFDWQRVVLRLGRMCLIEQPDQTISLGTAKYDKWDLFPNASGGVATENGAGGFVALPDFAFAMTHKAMDLTGNEPSRVQCRAFREELARLNYRVSNKATQGGYVPFSDTSRESPIMVCFKNGGIFTYTILRYKSYRTDTNLSTWFSGVPGFANPLILLEQTDVPHVESIVPLVWIPQNSQPQMLDILMNPTVEMFARGQMTLAHIQVPVTRMGVDSVAAGFTASSTVMFDALYGSTPPDDDDTGGGEDF